jgi:hypothetical protein
MHYPLLLLIVAISVVISSPIHIPTKSRSAALVKRQAATIYCSQGATLCCTSSSMPPGTLPGTQPSVPPSTPSGTTCVPSM